MTIITRTITISSSNTKQTMIPANSPVQHRTQMTACVNQPHNVANEKTNKKQFAHRQILLMQRNVVQSSNHAVTNNNCAYSFWSIQSETDVSKNEYDSLFRTAEVATNREGNAPQMAVNTLRSLKYSTTTGNRGRDSRMSWRYFCTCAVQVVQQPIKSCQMAKIYFSHRKSMSMRTTVISDKK